MSQRSSCDDEEGPPSSLVHTKSSSSLELTVENVQELEQQFGGTGSLYSSSCNVEYYVEDTQHCSQMDGETDKVCVGAGRPFITQWNGDWRHSRHSTVNSKYVPFNLPLDEKFQIDMRTGAQNINSRCAIQPFYGGECRLVSQPFYYLIT